MAGDDVWQTASGRKRNRSKGHNAQRSWGKGDVGKGPGGKGHGGKAQGGKGLGGKAQDGKAQGGKGQGGKGGTNQGGAGNEQNGKAGGTAEAKEYADWCIPWGTKIECPNAECLKVGEWADTAGWGCPKCGSAYRWGHLWDEVLTNRSKTPGPSAEEGGDKDDDTLGSADGSLAQPEAPKLTESEATTAALEAVKASNTAWAKAQAKLERERTDFVNMGQRLDRLQDQVDEHVGRMAARRKVVIAAVTEEAAAKEVHLKRVAERETAVRKQLDSIAGNLDASTDRAAVARRAAKTHLDNKAAELGKLQAEALKAEQAAAKGKRDREAKAKAEQERATKEAEEAAKQDRAQADLERIAQATKLALQQAEGGANDLHHEAPAETTATEGAPAAAEGAVGTEVDPGSKPFAELAALDEDMVFSDFSDDEEDKGTKFMDPDTWTNEVAEWAFYAKPDDKPNSELLGWFVSWEDDPTTIGQLEVLLLAARDKFLEARMGAASDGAAASQVASTGDLQSANNMLVASDAYSKARYRETRDQMVAHLQEVMRQMFAQRQLDLDAGKRKAPKAWKYHATHATMPTKAKPGAKSGVKRTDKKRATDRMAEATKAAKEKCKAGLAETGLEDVQGDTATAAAGGK